jgi:hypothetical protein
MQHIRNGIMTERIQTLLDDMNGVPRSTDTTNTELGTLYEYIIREHENLKVTSEVEIDLSDFVNATLKQMNSVIEAYSNLSRTKKIELLELKGDGSNYTEQIFVDAVARIHKNFYLDELKDESQSSYSQMIDAAVKVSQKYEKQEHKKTTDNSLEDLVLLTVLLTRIVNILSDTEEGIAKVIADHRRFLDYPMDNTLSGCSLVTTLRNIGAQELVDGTVKFEYSYYKRGILSQKELTLLTGSQFELSAEESSLSAVFNDNIISIVKFLFKFYDFNKNLQNTSQAINLLIEKAKE